ncbi:MAG: glycosyltransferase, partial [Chitinophagaceae bacterium]
KAAALYNDIHVLFVKQSERQKDIEKVWGGKDGLTEQIIYLPKKKGFLGKLPNYKEWEAHYKAQVGQIVESYQPQLIHVHIPWKVGLIALWAKRKFNLPFVVTEHWGIYNNIVEDNIHTKSFFFRYLLKLICKKADSFISVSRYLGNGVNQTLLKKEFVVIPNVVDTKLFFPTPKKYDQFTFLHVSNMVPLKNVESILLAFHQFLQNKSKDARLILIGNRDDQYERLVAGWNILNKSIFFKGEIAYADVAREMQSSHVFVLNSNIENSPCVIGEALCCGLPVIATSVGGISELVDNSNGLLIHPNSTPELESALIKAFDTYHAMQRKQPTSSARIKFSPNTIGSQIAAVYDQVLRKQP